MLHTHDLFQHILIEPHGRDADELRIVSGYATSMMARRHFVSCTGLRISLIVGMCPRDGLSMSNHRGFVGLSNQMAGNFTCLYNTGIATHSKLYVWYSNGRPVEAYAGSANYTQQAFIQHVQNEIICDCDPFEADEYYHSLLPFSLPCTIPTIGTRIRLLDRLATPRQEQQEDANEAIVVPAGLRQVELPLVDRNGNVPSRSGLNWGQREGRDPNQAYLSVPAPIAQSGFFPPRTVHFNVLTDDGQTMELSVAQDGDKALHSPNDNSIIGRYFRRRLGLQDGEYVTRAHLDAYGRTTVTMLKDDDENYYLDFSVR